MRDKMRATGMVTVRVLDAAGNVRRHRPGFLRRLFGLPGRPMVSCRHNIVTDEGDALVADAMLPSPFKAKVGTSGCIQVGTGWTGNGVKSNTRCNTPAGGFKFLDSGYPQLKGQFGEAHDNVVVYRATFGEGQIAASGINEVALLNGSGGDANCLAYAQITPAVNMTSSDTLQVKWELTFLGQ